MKFFPKKSLGQHFLNSSRVLEQIISAAEIKSGETVLEIGPGKGTLTETLLKSGAHVIAIEKDNRAIAPLTVTFEKEIRDGKLALIEGDILTTKSNDLPPLYKIVANIPYYITGAILEKFLEHDPRPDKMVILVQKEVAERIVAADGKESILSISVKAFGTPKIIAKVPRGSFSPPPAVESAILAINYISDHCFKEKNISIQEFFKIVRAGFAHKRKFAVRNLETVIGPKKIAPIWQEMALNPKIRAENMTLDQWMQIASLNADEIGNSI